MATSEGRTFWKDPHAPPQLELIVKRFHQDELIELMSVVLDRERVWAMLDQALTSPNQRQGESVEGDLWIEAHHSETHDLLSDPVIFPFFEGRAALLEFFGASQEALDRFVTDEYTAERYAAYRASLQAVEDRDQ